MALMLLLKQMGCMMKICNVCHIHIDTTEATCPLCGNGLQETAAAEYNVPKNHYPNLKKELVKYNFIMRILLFVSLLGCGVSVLINLLTNTTFLWCLIVVAAVVYAWLVVPSLLRQGFNYGLQALLQGLLASALCIALDFIIGYSGWSFTYVIPSIITLCILSVDLLSLFYRTNYTQYILYQIIVGVLGFVPLILYLTSVTHVFILAIIPACLGLASVLACLIFSDKSVKNEFKRRFHI